MAIETDTSNEKFAGYAHPDRLVSTGWLEERLGTDGLVVVESDEDVLLYETGHIPGAVKVDWHTELNDPVQRDYIDGAGFSRLLGSKGIDRSDTIVIYGDKNNWWAAYALWVFTLFGHEDVRLLDGGRDAWIAEGRPLTTEATERPRTRYPVVARDDTVVRAFKDDVLTHLGNPLIDVRSPEEYSGERTTGKAVADDGTFRPVVDLDSLYREGAGLQDGDDIVAYCRIGERSSHTWFVLTHLLGFENVRNYDGSWTEWGSAVRVPITTGSAPGSVPSN
jgi:thiosulfate/3-mercaptopyruvate sulfurtransferase